MSNIFRKVGISIILSLCFTSLIGYTEVRAENVDDDPWIAFAEDLKKAADVMLRDITPDDELTRAQGYRYLSRLVRAALDLTLEFNDPNQPEIVRAYSKTTNPGALSSDAIYHMGFINSEATYRVYGKRGNAPLFEFGVYDGALGLDESSALVGAMTEADLFVDAAGDYEIILSPVKHAGNWIDTSKNASYLLIRQYAHRWHETESATFKINKIAGVGTARALTVDLAASELLRASAVVRQLAYTYAGLVDRGMQSRANTLRVLPHNIDVSLPSGHRYATGWFKLEENEVLMLEFTPEQVPYWGIQLSNYWFEALDYEDQGSHLNNQTVHYEDDGSVKILIGSFIEGRNTLDTQGLRQGTIQFRWSRSELEVPRFKSTLIKR